MTTPHMPQNGPLSDSNLRVRDAANALGLTIDIRISAVPTKTAEEAALACNCDVAQIVKSLVFRGSDSAVAYLFLVSGRNRVDEAAVALIIGETLTRPDARFVREVTGYAIGGIPPIGHKTAMKTFIDRDLLAFERIYAAAGTPNSTFAIDPHALKTAAGATVISVV